MAAPLLHADTDSPNRWLPSLLTRITDGAITAEAAKRVGSLAFAFITTNEQLRRRSEHVDRLEATLMKLAQRVIAELPAGDGDAQELAKLLVDEVNTELNRPVQTAPPPPPTPPPMAAAALASKPAASSTLGSAISSTTCAAKCAVAMIGQARTLKYRAVWTSHLAHVIRPLQNDPSCSGGVDVFAVLGPGDDYDEHTAHVLRRLGAVRVASVAVPSSAFMSSQYRRWAIAHRLMRDHCSMGTELYAWVFKMRPDCFFFASIPPVITLASDRVHGVMRCSSRFLGQVITEAMVSPNMVRYLRRGCKLSRKPLAAQAHMPPYTASTASFICSCKLFGCPGIAANTAGELMEDQVAIVPRERLNSYFALDGNVPHADHHCMQRRMGAFAAAAVWYGLARETPSTSAFGSLAEWAITGGTPANGLDNAHSVRAGLNGTLYLDTPLDRQHKAGRTDLLNCSDPTIGRFHALRFAPPAAPPAVQPGAAAPHLHV